MKIEIGGQPVLAISNDMVDTTDGYHRARRIRSSAGDPAKTGTSAKNLKLVITSDTDEFDLVIIEQFQEEGYQIAYLPYSGDKTAYQQELQHLADPLDVGERYAIIAYGDAAAHCLQACTAPMPRLAAIVAYYPPFLPNAASSFPPSLEVLVHLAASQGFGTQYPSYRYPGTRDGFAESDLEDYDKIAASLAWSRTIACLRRVFGVHVDLEIVRDTHTRLAFETKSAEEAVKIMAPGSYVKNVPTMTGGKGAKELSRFYKNFFTLGNPPDLKITLISRTVGVDRIADEMLLKFTHTEEIPWILPGVPPTGKSVEVVLVGIMCIRGGLVYHEHVHWDQATVLVQVGLLDPKLIPQTFSTLQENRRTELTRLPVSGPEAARRFVNGDCRESNQLIPGW